MTEPTTEEMQAAWEVFKRSGLFAVLLGHMAPATVLDNEGVLWGIFYNGYMAGYRAINFSSTIRSDR